MKMEQMDDQSLKRKILSLVEEYYKQAHIGKNDFVPGKTYVKYGGRFYDEREMVNLVDSGLDFWLTAGSWAAKFEKRLASYLHVKHCSLVNSGSSANLLAFMSLTSSILGERRIQRGDEVITVAAGFPTTISPIIQYGAIPVFLDVSIPSYNIKVEHLEQALTRKTKAVMIAHTMGNPFDLKSVRDFCDRHKLWLVEDNCDALGSQYFIDGEWKLTGTIGDIATSSFYPPHHITMGEGGAVYTNNQKLSRIVNSLRDWGRDCWCIGGKDNTCGSRFEKKFGDLPLGYDHKYVYSYFGYNLKSTEMQAAIGCAQIDKIDQITTKRRENWKRLREGLNEIPGLILPEPQLNSDPSWFGFLLSVRKDAGYTRNELTRFLESKKIQTRNLFAGNILKHPAFDDMRRNGQGYRIVGKLNNTDYIMDSTFWLGVYPGMTDEMLDYTISTIINFIKLKSNAK